MAGGTEGLVRRDVVKAVCIRPAIREVRASRGGRGARSERQLGTDTGDDRRLQRCARGYVGQAIIIVSTGRNQESGQVTQVWILNTHRLVCVRSEERRVGKECVSTCRS